MKKFIVQGFDKGGNEFRKIIEADNKDQAIKKIQSKDLHLTSIRETSLVLERCPTCGEKLSDGVRGFCANKLLSKKEISIINECSDKKVSVYCSKCGGELLDSARRKIAKEKRDCRNNIKELIQEIPVVSTHTPLGWYYEALGIVTGQTTTGTGVVSEIASSFTDFFGAQSGKYNRKIKEGEDSCLAQLRIATLGKGGNAIIAVDIDYAELGSLKGMIMVCMTGTAVKIKNIDILNETKRDHIKRLTQLNERLLYLNSIERTTSSRVSRYGF